LSTVTPSTMGVFLWTVPIPWLPMLLTGSEGRDEFCPSKNRASVCRQQIHQYNVRPAVVCSYVEPLHYPETASYVLFVAGIITDRIAPVWRSGGCGIPIWNTRIVGGPRLSSRKNVEVGIAVYGEDAASRAKPGSKSRVLCRSVECPKLITGCHFSRPHQRRWRGFGTGGSATVPSRFGASREIAACTRRRSVPAIVVCVLSTGNRKDGCPKRIGSVRLPVC